MGYYFTEYVYHTVIISLFHVRCNWYSIVLVHSCMYVASTNRHVVGMLKVQQIMLWPILYALYLYTDSIMCSMWPSVTNVCDQVVLLLYVHVLIDSHWCVIGGPIC